MSYLLVMHIKDMNMKKNYAIVIALITISVILLMRSCVYSKETRIIEKVQIQPAQAGLRIALDTEDRKIQEERKVITKDASVGVGETFIVLLGLARENGDYYQTKLEGSSLQETEEPIYNRQWHQAAYKAIEAGTAVIHIYKGNYFEKFEPVLYKSIRIHVERIK